MDAMEKLFDALEHAGASDTAAQQRVQRALARVRLSPAVLSALLKRNGADLASALGGDDKIPVIHMLCQERTTTPDVIGVAVRHLATATTGNTSSTSRSLAATDASGRTALAATQTRAQFDAALSEWPPKHCVSDAFAARFLHASDDELLALLNRAAKDVAGFREQVLAQGAESPLSLAVASNRASIVECMLKELQRDAGKFTLDVPALLDASRGGPASVMLLDRGFAVDANKEVATRALVFAAARGEISTVEKLLELGCNPNSTASGPLPPASANLAGLPALHAAVQAGHLSTARLLEKHTSIDEYDAQGLTPLCHAPGNGVPMIRFLLQSKASLSLPLKDNPRNDTVAIALLLHPRLQRSELVELLGHQDEAKRSWLATALAADLAADAKSDSLLTRVVREGSADTLRFLQERGHVFRTKDGMTPLHAAVSAGNVATARTLIDAGEDVNARSGSHVPLSRVMDSAAMLQLLLDQGAEPTATVDDVPAAAVVLCRPHLDGDAARAMVGMLHERSAAWSALVTPKTGVPALLPLVAATGSAAAVEAVVKEGRVDVNGMVDRQDAVAPLHAAASHGNVAALRKLLELGADPNLKSRKGTVPLAETRADDSLERPGVCECQMELLRAGADPLVKCYSYAHKKDGNPAIFATVTRKDMTFDTMKAIIELLMERALWEKASTITDTWSNPLLNCVAYFGSPPCLKALLQIGRLDPNRHDTGRDGYVVHQDACCSGNDEMIATALDCGANVNELATGAVKVTAFALPKTQPRTMALLAKRGADPTIVGKDRKEADAFVIATKEDMDFESAKAIVEAWKKHGFWDKVQALQHSDGDSLLIASCWFGRTAVVKALLEVGKVDPNFRPKGYHSNALHFAARKGHEDIAKMLIEHGAKVNATTNKNFTPFISKQTSGKMKCFLAQHGADPSYVSGEGGDTDGFALAYRDDITYELAVAAVKGFESHGYLEKLKSIRHHKDGSDLLITAAWEGRLGLVKALLEFGGFNPNFVPKEFGSGPIHCAARKGHDDIIKALLEHKADVNLRTVKGNTAFALSQTPVRTKALLAQHGADPTLLSGERKVGDGFILATVDGIDYECAKAIVEGYRKHHWNAFVNMRHTDKSDVLITAAWAGNVAAVKALLDVGKPDIDPNCCPEGFSDPALHCAARKGHDEVVKLLLDRGADINAQSRDKYKLTPFASVTTPPRIMTLLAQRGADPAIVSGETGKDPDVFRILWKEGMDSESVKAILTAFAKRVTWEKLRTLRDEYSGNLLTLAVFNRNGDLPVIRFLVEVGGFEAKEIHDGYHSTPLHLAARKGKADVVTYLLDLGADPNVQTRDKFKLTPFACASTPPRIMTLLAQRGADPAIVSGETGKDPDIFQVTWKEGMDAENAKAILTAFAKRVTWEKLRTLRDEYSLDLLSAACWNANGSLSVVKELVEKGGFDVNEIPSGCHSTPLHLAARKGKADVVTYLLDRGADVNQQSGNPKRLPLASSECSVKVVLLLLERGADPSMSCTHKIDGFDDLKGPALWQVLSRKLSDAEVADLMSLLDKRQLWPGLLGAKDSAGRGILGWVLQVSEPNVITAVVRGGKLDPVAEMGDTWKEKVGGGTDEEKQKRVDAVLAGKPSS